ncbi:MAG TPA: 2-dehydropantoate 2-reductase [Chloroflexota bacterium]|nr:2-dehydropantoate 2-reductase [Chloroflexota bacterium]
MRIAVIGAGAIGGFVGGLLARGGHEVRLLARGPHLDALRRGGLQVRSKQLGDFAPTVSATDDPAELGANDLVVLSVKMYDFAPAAEAAKQALAPDGQALTLQNGLDAPDELAGVVGRERVLVGTIAGEFTILEPGIVGHLTPQHVATISPLDGGVTPRLDTLAETMKISGLNVSIVEDGMRALWQKACGLIPFATITAAAECNLGEFMGQPASRDLWEALLAEIIAVGNACGYDLHQPVAGWRAFAQRGIETSPAFTSSLARDLQAGRRTELEWLTGKIVRLSVEKSVPAPVHRALYGVLKIKEAQRSS